LSPHFQTFGLYQGRTYYGIGTIPYFIARF